MLRDRAAYDDGSTRVRAFEFARRSLRLEARSPRVASNHWHFTRYPRTAAWRFSRGVHGEREAERERKRERNVRVGSRLARVKVARRSKREDLKRRHELAKKEKRGRRRKRHGSGGGMLSVHSHLPFSLSQHPTLPCSISLGILCRADTVSRSCLRSASASPRSCDLPVCFLPPSTREILKGLDLTGVSALRNCCSL